MKTRNRTTFHQKSLILRSRSVQKRGEMMPNWGQNPSENHSGKMNENGTKSASKMAPKTAPKRPKLISNGYHGPRWASEGPKVGPKRPK